jgi:hypothetical protein
MKKQFVFLGIFFILVCVELTGCNQITNLLNGNKGGFIGRWKGLNDTVIMDGIRFPVIDFFSNGTYSIMYSIMDQTGTWDLKDGKLVLTFSGGGGLTCYYRFSNNDRLLTLTSTLGGSSETLIRQ